MIIKTKFEGYVRGIRLYPFKDTPEAPPAPDPTVVSKAQTQSNTETARLNAKLNRVNQVTPYGKLTYSQAPAVFDQAGYDKAVAEFNAQSQQPMAGRPGMTYGTSAGGESNDFGQTQGTGGVPQNAQTGTRTAPTREQFMTPSDQWEARIDLSPEQQKLLDSDNRIKAQLGSAAEAGLGRVTQTMASPFDTSGMNSYRDVPQGGGAPAGGGAQRFTAPNQTYTTGLNGGSIQKALPNSDYANQRTRVEDAIYSRLEPKLTQDRAGLDQRLANQGIMPGSEAYNRAITESTQQANDARMQAILAGGQEQSRLAGLDLAAGNFANNAQAQAFSQQAVNANLNNSVNDTRFNQALQATGFNNAANQQDFSQQLASNQQNFAQQLAAAREAANQRGQQFNEASFLRSLPMNELNALRTGSQVVNPSFTPTPSANVAGTDVSGNIWQNYNAQMNNASNQTAQNNSFMNGLFSLGSAGITAFSDRRLKKNIERIGTYRGIGVYKWDYLWGESATGLMADEVETIQPDAIGERMGFKTVDYSKV